MKKYIDPEITFEKISAEDVITTSLGTETTPYDENDGVWDLNFGF